MLLIPAPFLVAFGLSAIIALLAWRLRSLSLSGALAATLVGTVALLSSYGAGVYVVVWFGLATILSQIGKAKKASRLADIVQKSSHRDAWQVLANGGVFSALVLSDIIWGAQCDLFSGCGRILVAAAAALAAAGADTWATEIGTLVGATPWSLRTVSRVPTGTSGAITLAGTVSLFAGATALAFLALVLGVVSGNRSVVAVAVGGCAGALADTVLGAWVQERRWCPRCTSETEQRVHRCGTPTVYHCGLSGLNNDVVNFLCTIVGAAVALLLVLS